MTEARKLEASNDFLIVNRGVARRPITPMGAPALVLNYVFWRPEKTESKIWRQQIDRFLWHIFVQSLPDEPLPSEPSADDYFDALILNSNLLCRGLVKLDDHYKIHLFRHSIDVDILKNEPSAKIKTAWSELALDENMGDKTRFQELKSDQLVIRYEHFSFELNYEINDIKCKLLCWAEQRSEFWTLSFVADFSNTDVNALDLTQSADFKKLFAPAANEFSQHVSEHLINPALRKADIDLKIYGVFSTVVLGHESLVDDEQKQWIKFEPINNSEHLDLNENTWTKKGDPEVDILGRARQDLNFQRFQEKGLSERVIDEAWRYLYESVRPQSNKKIEPNLAVTKIIQGRLIHISALGTTLAGHSLTEQPPVPVRSVMITSTPNEWTIGHAVERASNLGVMRLAALKHIDRLQEFSNELDELTAKWQSALGDFNRAKESKPSNTAMAQNVLDEAARGLNEELRTALNKIEGGILDRISRSAYWVELFRQVQGGLGMGSQAETKIADFQTYDDFVTRRLGATFEFIQRLGRRYHEFQTIISEHLRNRSAIDLHEIRLQSNETLNGINQATSALKASVATLNDTVEKQKSLLEIADDVLPIIVWYHLGAILHYMGFNAWAFEYLKAVHLVTLETPSHESGDVLSFAAGLIITAAIFHEKFWSLLKKLGAV